MSENTAKSTHTLPAPDVLIGTAGWSLPRPQQSRFGEGASHLERYATRLAAVEINSSFYRSHQPGTWERWRDTVPPQFRFAVKMPKKITHEARLQDTEELLAVFLEEANLLGKKLGCLLLQLPPSLAFDSKVASHFFRNLRAHTSVPVVCEGRHPSWFAPEPEALLREMRIARVAADPAPVPEAAEPGGWMGLVYFRLHGSPKVYYSDYSSDFLASLRGRIEAASAKGSHVWCIFDNTAAGAATANALALDALCSPAPSRSAGA